MRLQVETQSHTDIEATTNADAGTEPKADTSAAVPAAAPRRPAVAECLGPVVAEASIEVPWVAPEVNVSPVRQPVLAAEWKLPIKVPAVATPTLCIRVGLGVTRLNILLLLSLAEHVIFELLEICLCGNLASVQVVHIVSCFPALFESRTQLGMECCIGIRGLFVHVGQLGHLGLLSVDLSGSNVLLMVSDVNRRGPENRSLLLVLRERQREPKRRQ